VTRLQLSTLTGPPISGISNFDSTFERTDREQSKFINKSLLVKHTNQFTTQNSTQGETNPLAEDSLDQSNLLTTREERPAPTKGLWKDSDSSNYQHESPLAETSSRVRDIWNGKMKPKWKSNAHHSNRLFVPRRLPHSVTNSHSEDS